MSRLSLLCLSPYLLNLEYKQFPRAVQRRLYQTLTMMIPAFSKEEGCHMVNLRYLHQSHWQHHRYRFFEKHPPFAGWMRMPKLRMRPIPPKGRQASPWSWGQIRQCFRLFCVRYSFEPALWDISFENIKYTCFWPLVFFVKICYLESLCNLSKSILL